MVSIQHFVELKRIEKRYRLKMREIFPKLAGGRPVRLAAAMMLSLGLGALSLGLAGCSQLHHKPSNKYVYVSAQQTFLRDRVAAVSNRTGTVTNGEQLIVLDRTKRWVKVQTASGGVGWIEERLTVPQTVEDQFEALGKDHEKDPVVATATTSDEVYLHVAPGRVTDHLYMLQANDKLSLIERASVPKPLPPGGLPAQAGGQAAEPVAPVMEDWWLVRNAKGQAGWIYGRMIDVSAPDTLLRYAEGQRMVGAYVLAHVDDPESGMVDNGNAVTSIPEYLTVLSPYKAGLPYDFNQVRVFIWNVKKHRYETGFSERNIVGYLPVKIGAGPDPYDKGADAAENLPKFTYRLLAGDQAIPQPDPTTGLIKPGRTIEKTYRLEGNICRRIIAPGVTAPEEAHPEVEVKKPRAAVAKRRRR
jgi:hypothetical protein